MSQKLNYMNKKYKYLRKFSYWLENCKISEDGWMSNNLHIDEIDNKLIDRKKWFKASFKMLNEFSQEKTKILPYILFLHFDLKDSKNENYIAELSCKWIKKKMSLYTPPSFNITSIEYYCDFYLNELTQCQIDSCLFEKIKFNTNINFYFRTYYDESEDAFSQELYIFYIPK